MSQLTPNLPPEEEEGEEGREMLGANVEVDDTPLQEQLARNKECKYLKLDINKVLNGILGFHLSALSAFHSY